MRLLALLVLASSASGPTPDETGAMRAITPAELRAHARFLASDVLGGRAPGSEGDRLSQQYIAAQLEALGLTPAGLDGSFYQPVPLIGMVGQPQVVEVATTGGDRRVSLAAERDFMITSRREGVVQLERAPLVFVGYGIVAPEFEWDDFKGVDVRGKVLIVLNDDPSDSPDLFGGVARVAYGRWDHKFETAARMGARGALVIHTDASAGYPWSVVTTSWGGEQFDPSASALVVRGWIREETLRRALALGGADLDRLVRSAQRPSFRPVPLGLEVSLRFRNVARRVASANVLAVLPGADPALSGEWVVFSAHHDHLGRRPDRGGGDEVFNGAVDNASGVAALLAVARAFTSLRRPPSRTVLFAATAAEEQGLLGSRALVEHPPVPVGRMVANINIDGLNIWGRTRDVTVIGLGRTSLDEDIRWAARTQRRVVLGDPQLEKGYFYRSDQLSFAKGGVPSTHFGSGLDYVDLPPGFGAKAREDWERSHYHQPSDEVTLDWQLDGAVEDVRLFFLVGHRVANAAVRPTWRKGDEFEPAHRSALEALRGR